MAGRHLEFAGIVDTIPDQMFYGPRIGGVDVIERIDKTAWRGGPVTVYLGVEPLATGRLAADEGFSGTDVTPGNGPTIWVGDFDLMDRLYDLDGREVLLVIEDAPA